MPEIRETHSMVNRKLPQALHAADWIERASLREWSGWGHVSYPLQIKKFFLYDLFTK